MPCLLYTSYNWGEHDMRWELEALGGGTRLTLWTNIGRRFIAMGAAGWHICFDVLDHVLSGTPLGRIVGAEAMKFDWQRLNAEYAKPVSYTHLDVYKRQICSTASWMKKHKWSSPSSSFTLGGTRYA